MGVPDEQLMLDVGFRVSSRVLCPIRAAAEAFESGSERPRVIVALSDGEDPTYAADVGIRSALGAEARVIAIAIGTEIGATIPAVIISEMPLPMPYSSICSPNHIKKTVPVVSTVNEKTI